MSRPALTAIVSLLLAIPSNVAFAQLEGTKIAFASDRGGDRDLYLMNPDGSGVELLAAASVIPAFETHPAWSADGRFLAFASDRDGDLEIYVLDVCAGTVKQLTNNSAADINPAWSPDGLEIAFESLRDGNQEIYKMTSDGGNQVNLTNHGSLDGRPDWSPDGQKIVFHSRRFGTDDVYVMNTDGSGLTKLTSNLWADFTRWSPDGAQIAFSHSGRVWVMNADGSNLHAILTVPGSISPLVGDWSPDGSKIVLFSDRFAPTWEVHTMDSGGGNLLNITNDPATDQDPSWSPPLGACLSCEGFAAPLDDYPVTVRGKRALPLKALLVDSEGVEVTSAGLSAAPVIKVLFESGAGGAVDVTHLALPVGLGDQDNQFVYAEGEWRFNLKTDNYSSPGTYTVRMESGDDADFGIDPTCVTQFVIQ